MKSHQDGYGPTMAQLSNIVEFKTLEKTNRCEEMFLPALMRPIMSVQTVIAIWMPMATKQVNNIELLYC